MKGAKQEVWDCGYGTIAGSKMGIEEHTWGITSKHEYGGNDTKITTLGSLVALKV